MEQMGFFLVMVVLDLGELLVNFFLLGVQGGLVVEKTFFVGEVVEVR